MASANKITYYTDIIKKKYFNDSDFTTLTELDEFKDREFLTNNLKFLFLTSLNNDKIQFVNYLLIHYREFISHSILTQALKIATENDNIYLVKLLISFGANDTYLYYPNSALLIACKHDYDDIAKLLLDNSTEINSSAGAGGAGGASKTKYTKEHLNACMSMAISKLNRNIIKLLKKYIESDDIIPPVISENNHLLYSKLTNNTFNSTFSADHYMFLQSGANCAIDALFTVIFESSVLRPYFTDPVFIENTVKLTGYKYLFWMYKRYMKMKLLERVALSQKENTSRTRRKSVNTKYIERTHNKIATGNVYGSCAYKGTKITDILNTVDKLIVDNIYLPMSIRVNPLHITDNKTNKKYNLKLDSHAIYGILLICYLKNIKNNTWDYTKLGHTVALYKNAYNWYFADDTTGIIKKLEVEFINKLFVALNTDFNFIKIIETPDEKFHFILETSNVNNIDLSRVHIYGIYSLIILRGRPGTINRKITYK